ncbi:MAG: glycosyltransferase family A protein [Muribaculaceae bacterium]
MNKEDSSIIKQSNIQSDVVVINQCDKNSIERFTFKNYKNEDCNAIFVCTTERGLSRSRNMAISYAPDDSICVLGDDDEIFETTAQDEIVQSYETMPDCDVATFSLIRKDCGRVYPSKGYRVKLKNALYVNSLQITFKKNSILNAGIRFDVKMGSGTGNGGGEENKFILDCLKSKLRIQYFPINIATVLPGESQWFLGFDAKYLENKGWSSKRILGPFWGLVYVVYSVFHLRKRYKEKLSMPAAFRAMVKGYYSKR